jgi:hypothetical protein
VNTFGAKGVVGPDLSDVGTRLTPAEICRAILDLKADVAKNCPYGMPCRPESMPANYGGQPRGTELQILVMFPSSLGAPTESAP